MSKVKIQGHASGSGVLTVTAPNTSTDRTITLPDTTGTLLDENSSVPAANLTGTVADARISALTASKLTGALPAISGASLTGITTGKVLQVTYNSQDFSCTETGASFTNVSDGSTTFGGAITPSSTSSKILVIWTMRYAIDDQNRGFKMRLNRDISGGAVTATFTQTDQKYYYHNSTGSGAQIRAVAHHEYLDSPNTTSAVTYYPQVYMDGGGAVNFGSGDNGFQITLMEIGA